MLAGAVGDGVRDGLRDAMQRGYVVAHRILGNADAARDACQEAAARALSSKHRYDPSRPFYPWFYRILKNHCLDRLKKRKRSVVVESPEGQATDASAERRLVDDERTRAVTRAIDALSDEHREIIELRHFSDLSYDEIAEVLGHPVGTVMSRLYRARKHMRETLRRDPEFNGDPR